jgi:hypothetical protein
MLGSLSEKDEDSAIYIVMKSIYDLDGTMGPILASAHAYWEGGYLWLIICGFLTGIIWIFFLTIFKSFPRKFVLLITLTLASSLLIDGIPTIDVPFYAYLIRANLTIIPLTILYRGLKFFPINSKINPNII